MDTHKFTTRVKGEDCEIEIKKGLTWGEVQELLKKSVTLNETGAKDLNFNNFCDILIQKTIVGGLPFPTTDYTALKNLDMDEMSVILGEILKTIPLERYFKNLGVDQVPFLNPSEA